MILPGFPIPILTERDPVPFTTDWKFPTAFTTVFTDDSQWFNEENVYADDGNYANANAPGGEWQVNDSTDRTAYSGFGFTTSDVPSGATITGIEYEAQWGRSPASGSYERSYLFHDAPLGTNTSAGSIKTGISSVDTDTVLPDEITAAHIITSDFALRFSMFCTAKGSASLLLYYLKCRIHGEA